MLKKLNEIKLDNSPPPSLLPPIQKKKKATPSSYYLTNPATPNNQLQPKSINSVSIPLLVFKVSLHQLRKPTPFFL